MIDLQNTFADFSEKKILVLGDVMVDTYLTGSVTRISPEAPVPVVRFKSRESRLGGAANVAMNIKALGAEAIICSVIGQDEEGDNFLRLLDQNKLRHEGILRSADLMTTVKTRIIGNNQQLLRIDHEEIIPLNATLSKQLVERIRSIIQKEQIAAIIFEDYNKGVLVPDVIQHIIQLANEKGIITTVDPKKENFFEYKNVTLFKPNLKELKEGTNTEFSIKDKSAFLNAVSLLNTKLNPKHTFVTLSEHGVYINDEKQDHFIPAHYRLITDVSGAGDTVISVATLCLACGLTAKLSAEIANLAGGLVCEKVGVVSVDKEQLMNEALNLL
ncbi:MAG: D-glycero-beta-D-manno-heptose-7-phosphate kinase [Crocinitomicaceae bacterium]|nr:D-glycero-beta-D-manno-heptose-7-phosphate kinase [Crocinitomicaceae bacterium]MBK8925679.1 D-glycero-beta-D-manno-heptose-7-phosphate kinase [Crocinitomicaceae bacterium]